MRFQYAQLCLTGVLLLLAGGFPSAFGLWANLSEPVPVERLIRNLVAHLQDHPKDARAYYSLARVHSLAFARASNQIKVTLPKDSPLPQFPPWERIQAWRNRSLPSPLEADLEHLEQAIVHYRKATELDPNEPMYYLGLGWVIEQAEETPGLEVDVEKALEAYRKAYQLALPDDLQLEHLGPQADSAISLEAGQGIVRILKRRSVGTGAEIDRVQESIRTLRKKPRTITPIIFSLERKAALAELLSEKRLVCFDLDGDGEPGFWPWVRPDVGILVWDPTKSGRVESGRQLFGSVTWWISWRDGYEPLKALDDDRDGLLSGPELEGVGVWQDRNENGRSDPGEVRTVTSRGIVAVAVHMDRISDGVPAQARGIYLEDGRVFPSYDWTPTRAREIPAVPASQSSAARRADRCPSEGLCQPFFGKGAESMAKPNDPGGRLSN